TTAAWNVRANVFRSGFGDRMAVGDFNDDGVPDVAIGVPRWDTMALVNTGKVEVYNGIVNAVPLTTPSWTVIGTAGSENLGEGLGVGDFNGDGVDDLAVGAPGRTVGAPSSGGADLYLGSLTGLSNTAAWTAGGPSAGSLFGYDLGGAGDVNNDGCDDLLIGASVNATFGSAFVY